MSSWVARLEGFVREKRGWFLLIIFAAALIMRLAYNF
jgi:hypothetical protein